MKSPRPTVITAMKKLPTVVGTSKRSGLPVTVKPTIAMKCMTQMPVPPIAHAARTSSQARRRPSVATRARAVLTRPSREPRNDMANAKIGVIAPYVKWFR